MHNNDLFCDFSTQLYELAAADASFKVALSGGLDSVVLLHLFSRLENATISAQHVHHGLSDNADSWATFCTQYCASLSIPIKVGHVSLENKTRTSLEALAREKRYALLQEGFHEHSYLVTGHHQDDQLETLLLALKRGAGLTGLQGILPSQRLKRGHLIRPLLNFSREQLEAYATLFTLNWIEDESNEDQQFDRNFIRHSITPLLKKRWPAISKTVARSATHCQAQQQLVNEISAADFLLCQAPTERVNEQALVISAIKGLSAIRRNNLLRYWFKQAGYPYPSSKQLLTIWQDVVLAQQDAVPQVKLQGAVVCRYREYIYLVAQSSFVNRVEKVRWQGESQLTLLGGTLNLTFEASELFLQQAHRVEICFRQHLSSDFKCRPLGRDKRRSIKKLLHEYHVPPWLREYIAFVFIDGELTEALGLFHCSTVYSTQLRITIT